MTAFLPEFLLPFVRFEAVARSATNAESRLRKDEAELMLQWVERAKKVEPSGQVMIARAVQRDELLLENGDVIRIPVQDGLVLVSGEVVFPKYQRVRSQARPAGLHQASRWLFAKCRHLAHHHRTPRRRLRGSWRWKLGLPGL